jgi:hypothetical protein
VRNDDLIDYCCAVVCTRWRGGGIFSLARVAGGPSDLVRGLLHITPGRFATLRNVIVERQDVFKRPGAAKPRRAEESPYRIPEIALVKTVERKEETPDEARHEG